VQHGTWRRAVVACLLIGVLAALAAAAAGAAIEGPTVITVPGTYVLERNLTVSGGTVAIEVRSPNVTIDGNGWTIAGRDVANSCGVLVHAQAGRVRNVTVRNLNIRDLQYGCYFWNTESTSVEECLVESCTYGVTFNPAARGCVTASRFEGNDYGLAISGRSTSSAIRSNRVTNSTRTGIYLYRTRGGLITDNYLANARNVYIGDQAAGFNWTAMPRAGRSVAGGPLLGGNFWGRPNGRGFSQTSKDADRDGICDRTYRVSGYMVDTLPLRERINRTPPVAGFSASPSSGTAPLTVRFNDTSRGDAAIWDWSFGDGTTSIGRNATHRYAVPGRYAVTLRVRDATGANASLRTRAITVAAPVKRPTAAFRAAPRSGAEPLAVQFTDASTGSPRTWRWTFGDGTSSTDRNPRHVYREAGSYTIGLRVSNAAGSSTRTATRHVTVTAPLREKGY
jgi:parallel beta-helix repeat protein